jgi:hypothetical protein
MSSSLRTKSQGSHWRFRYPRWLAAQQPMTLKTRPKQSPRAEAVLQESTSDHSDSHQARSSFRLHPSIITSVPTSLEVGAAVGDVPVAKFGVCDGVGKPRIATAARRVKRVHERAKVGKRAKMEGTMVEKVVQYVWQFATTAALLIRMDSMFFTATHLSDE